MPNTGVRRKGSTTSPAMMLATRLQGFGVRKVSKQRQGGVSHISNRASDDRNELGALEYDDASLAAG